MFRKFIFNCGHADTEYSSVGTTKICLVCLREHGKEYAVDKAYHILNYNLCEICEECYSAEPNKPTDMCDECEVLTAPPEMRMMKCVCPRCGVKYKRLLYWNDREMVVRKYCDSCAKAIYESDIDFDLYDTFDS